MWYEVVKDNEWIIVDNRNCRIACCDCGLVHRVKFRLRKRFIAIKAIRDKRATAAKRRNKKYKYGPVV